MDLLPVVELRLSPSSSLTLPWDFSASAADVCADLAIKFALSSPELLQSVQAQLHRHALALLRDQDVPLCLAPPRSVFEETPAAAPAAALLGDEGTRKRSRTVNVGEGDAASGAPAPITRSASR